MVWTDAYLAFVFETFFKTGITEGILKSTVIQIKLYFVFNTLSLTCS